MQEEKLENQAPAGEEKSLEALLAEAQAKIEQQRDAMLRAVAEAENVRKRVQAEAQASQKYALERFAEGLLPVVDSLEAAIAAQDTSGVDLTHKQLLAAMGKAHIQPIEPQPGDRFDPYRHQAMAAVPSETAPNTIVQVMQKGYLLHDRVLRPALVTVAKAIENAAGNPTSATDSN
ncbi:MAG TPA: nucleotide exchange factor GrpE [Burkholderiales bacterium]|nr:nucleotide exchange factor GrpE [Burkholderiales bacterium]